MFYKYYNSCVMNRSDKDNYNCNDSKKLGMWSGNCKLDEKLEISRIKAVELEAFSGLCCSIAFWDYIGYIIITACHAHISHESSVHSNINLCQR